MDKHRGKGLSFARRIYMPRTIGLGIGCFSVAAALYPLSLPTWVWLLLLFNGFIWPHLAYQLSTRAAFPYKAETRNLLYDSLCGGFWVGAFQFNPLPTVTVLAMMAMNNVAAGGKHLFVRGALAQMAGAAISVVLFGAAFTATATPIQVLACLPMLTLYPLALGMACYRLAIKLSEHKRALAQLSRTDSLTELLNHGAWTDLLHVQFERCRTHRESAVLALIDIDHFKTINDAYGHLVGNAVLRQLSQALRSNMHESDLAGRYGGDEFCVILPQVSLAQAQQAMERLRQVLHDYRHPQAPDLRVCLSIGLSDCQPTFSDANTWLNDADQALYSAKKTGRNRISSSLTGSFVDSERSVSP